MMICRKKKWITIAVLAVFIVGCLTACGESKPAAEESEQTAATEQTTKSENTGIECGDIVLDLPEGYENTPSEFAEEVKGELGFKDCSNYTLNKGDSTRYFSICFKPDADESAADEMVGVMVEQGAIDEGIREESFGDCHYYLAPSVHDEAYAAFVLKEKLYWVSLSDTSESVTVEQLQEIIKTIHEK